ncbi:MAG: immune inhibitor A [Saprospiraceae bacterium]|nr:immune inhibitor A [Saprospiraceae bacterium]
MKKTICLLAIVAIAAHLFAQSGADSYSRLRIDLSQRTLAELAALGIDADHGIHAPGRFFIGDFSAREGAMMQEAGWSTEVLIADVQAWYVEQSRQPAPSRDGGICDPNARYKYATPANFNLGSMAGFYTYEEMLAELDDMAAQYPELITARAPVTDAYTTHEGRPLYWLRISDNAANDEPETEVLYTALHHAREPNSLSQLIFYMWYLLENYATNDEVRYIVDNTELYFIPCLNPDGYIYNQVSSPEGGGLWRKNRLPNEDGSYGIDLNRNYAYQWGFDNQGSSPNPESQVYRGTEPFSEAETRMVRDFCEQHDFVLALNYHTFGNLLVHPWGYSDTLTADAATFNALADAMIYQNYFLAGTGTETVGYTVNGNSDDWMYGENTTKPAIYSMTPEVGRRDDSGGFWPPIYAIETNCKGTMWMNLSMALSAHNFGIAQEINAKVLRQKNGHLSFRLRRHGLEDGALTVAISPLSANITGVGEPKTFTLDNYEPVVDSIAYTLASATGDEAEVVFLLSVDNGAFVRSDTVRFYYSETPVVFDDAGNNLNQWTVENGNWGVTFNEFHLGPSCISDSPAGPSDNNAFTTITTTQPIALGDFAKAYLSFWTQWELEPSFDYAQVQLSVNGGEFVPLCGNYTVAGTDFQASDEPVYEGEQGYWVHEWIDLGPYVAFGDQIRVRFLLGTDSYGTGDGFAFDEVQVHTWDGISTGVIDQEKTAYYLQSYPNPARDEVTLRAYGAVQQSEGGVLRVYNSVGQLQWQGPAQSDALGWINRLDISAWQSGAYTYRFEVNGVSAPAGKFVITK